MQGQHVAAWKIFLMTALLAGMFAFSFWVNVRVSDRIGKKQVELNHENERINFYMVICLKSLHRRRRRRISGFMECRIIFVEKMRHVSRHHPIFQKKGFSRKKSGKVFICCTASCWLYLCLCGGNGDVRCGDDRRCAHVLRGDYHHDDRCAECPDAV